MNQPPIFLKPGFPVSQHSKPGIRSQGMIISIIYLKIGHSVFEKL